MMNYCALCGVEHGVGECCGAPKDVDQARRFFLDILDVINKNDQQFSPQVQVLADFITMVASEKIPLIYREFLVHLIQDFRKVEDKDGLAMVERAVADRFN